MYERKSMIRRCNIIRIYQSDVNPVSIEDMGWNKALKTVFVNPGFAFLLSGSVEGS